MMYDFRDRSVVVTGGTGTLGTAVVGLLLGAGAKVTVTCLDPAELRGFAHRDRVRIVEGIDLSDESAVQAIYRGFGEGDGQGGGEGRGGGRLWASIHVAGGFSMAPVTETSKSDLLRQLDMNLVSCFLCCREAVRTIRSGGGRGGRIVNVAARPGVSPELGASMVAYTTAKAGVTAMTRGLGAEVLGDGILVNAVAPSIMDTPANRAAMPKADHSAWPKVEEVAAAIAFLASPANRVTSGAVIPVYGRA